MSTCLAPDLNEVHIIMLCLCGLYPSSWDGDLGSVQQDPRSTLLNLSEVLKMAVNGLAW